MKTKTVSYTLETLPPLTDAQVKHLETLDAMGDEGIDFSDIPQLSDAELAEMRPVLYRPVKQQITARVDADVLAWLKSQGKGYQSRINAILRREMLKSGRD